MNMYYQRNKLELMSLQLELQFFSVRIGATRVTDNWGSRNVIVMLVESKYCENSIVENKHSRYFSNIIIVKNL